MRFIVNIAIKTGIILLFCLFGWLTLLSAGAVVTTITWPIVGSAALLALLFTVVRWAFNTIWLIAGIASLGLLLLLGLLFYPLIGWAILAITAALAPGMILLHSFWITVLCGFILTIAQLSSPKKDLAVNVNTNSENYPITDLDEDGNENSVLPSKTNLRKM